MALAVMGFQTVAAGSPQAYVGVHLGEPGAQGPPGLAPEPCRPQGQGGPAAHHGLPSRS